MVECACKAYGCACLQYSTLRVHLWLSALVKLTVAPADDEDAKYKQTLWWCTPKMRISNIRNSNAPMLITHVHLYKKILCLHAHNPCSTFIKVEHELWAWSHQFYLYSGVSMSCEHGGMRFPYIVREKMRSLAVYRFQGFDRCVHAPIVILFLNS
jgi:hypothetical protein